MLKGSSTYQLLAGEDSTLDARLLVSAPHGGRREHTGNEGRRGFSRVNPPNPPGK